MSRIVDALVLAWRGDRENVISHGHVHRAKRTGRLLAPVATWTGREERGWGASVKPEQTKGPDDDEGVRVGLDL